MTEAFICAALRTPIGVLSPGQQQRLSIVRALSTRPDVLTLDEPIASLDPATRIAVIDEIISERARRPVSIIFSSHLIGDLDEFIPLPRSHFKSFHERTSRLVFSLSGLQRRRTLSPKMRRMPPLKSS